MRAAFVLAAGFGTRLRPYTQVMPKPLIPVAGIEPLFFALWRAKSLGAELFYVNAHYHHEQIGLFLKQVAEPVLGIKVSLIVEDPILGTGGAIRNLLKISGAEKITNLLVLNGDTLLGLSSGSAFESETGTWCLVSSQEDFLKKYKPMWVDSSGCYSGVGLINEVDKKWVPKHFLGLHSLCNSALKELRSDDSPVKEEDLFKAIYRPLTNAEFCIKAVDHKFEANEFWFDMTSKDFLLEAQSTIISGLESKDSIWKLALEARWQMMAREISGSWLIGEDPGCVNWSQTKRSIVVSNGKKTVNKGPLELDSSVLILKSKNYNFKQSRVRNSLILDLGQGAVTKDSDLVASNEIIFL